MLWLQSVHVHEHDTSILVGQVQTELKEKENIKVYSESSKRHTLDVPRSFKRARKVSIKEPTNTAVENAFLLIIVPFITPRW